MSVVNGVAGFTELKKLFISDTLVATNLEIEGTLTINADLDMNGFNIMFDTLTGIEDSAGNEIVLFEPNATDPKNYLVIKSGGTAGMFPGAVKLTSEGDDTDVGIRIVPKGAGVVHLPLATLQLGTSVVLADGQEISISSYGGTVPATVTLVGTDGFPVNDGGVTSLALISDIVTFVAPATKTLTNTTIDANGVGNSITNIDLTADVINTLPVANGGTGAATLTDGGILLGSGTGAITAMAVLADSEMIVGNGTTDPVAESGATLRTSIGVGTGNSPQFTAIELGAVSDTTISRVSAGVVAIEGVTIITTATGQPLDADLTSWAAVTRASGFDTFATTPTSANLAALVTNETGTGALVFGTAPQISTIELGNASDTTIARVSAGVMSVEGVTVLTTSNTATLTNKSYDAHGTGNSLTGLLQNDITQQINAQTGTTYTLADSDHGKLVTLDNAAAIALSINTGLRSDFACSIAQVGAGQVTISGTATCQQPDGFTKTEKQFVQVSIIHRGSNLILLDGRLVA